MVVSTVPSHCPDTDSNPTTLFVEETVSLPSISSLFFFPLRKIRLFRRQNKISYLRGTGDSIGVISVVRMIVSLSERVNRRYLIYPPPGSPNTGNKDIVYEVLMVLYGNPSSPRLITWQSRSRPSWLFSNKIVTEPTVMTVFKQDLLSRFVGTDEGEVTEYLEWEIMNDREGKTWTERIVQTGYATWSYFHCLPSVNTRVSTSEGTIQ